MISLRRLRWTESSQGFVLVNVLVVVLALSFVAMQLLKDATDSVERLALAQTTNQLELYSIAGVDFAANLLAEDASASEIDYLGELWALRSYPAEIKETVVTVTVEDQESLFNLNLLVSPTPGLPKTMLERLVRQFEPASEITDIAVDLYARYQPSGSQVQIENAGKTFLDGDLTHLAQVAQLLPDDVTRTADVFEMLTVLPRSQRVNVNTASSDILVAVTGLDEVNIAEIIKLRDKAPFEDMADFAKAVEDLAGPVVASALPNDFLGVTSDWFVVTTEVELGEVVHLTRTVVHRDRGDGGVEIFWREAEARQK